MPKTVRYLIAAALLAAFIVFSFPWLKNAAYFIRLTNMPAPDSLPVPVENVKPGALADTWHAARAPTRRHEGIDIFAKKGTPVLSATEGILLGFSENSLGGNVAWVLGPGGQRHYYAHLYRYADLPKGARVMTGTVLGYVGNTGNARTTPPHLHYGIYTTDGAINPYPLLTKQGMQR